MKRLSGIINAMIYAMFYALAMLAAYRMCLTVYSVILPHGFETPLNADGLFRYGGVFFLGLFAVLLSIEGANWSIRWIHGHNQNKV